jgi:hypothetical protein
MDKKDDSLKHATKLMQGKTLRSSGQRVQRTLSDQVWMEMIEEDPTLMRFYQDHEMINRPLLPEQQEWVSYLRSQTSATELAKLTKIKKSTVDHWFRRDDKGFSYPSLEDWNKIKPYLKEIKFDKELTTVEVIEWQQKEDWPTPTTQDTEHTKMKINKKGRRLSKDGKTSHSLNLADKVQVRQSSVKEKWSTPTASQASKPVNKKAPSVASGSHGSTLEQDVGERNPELIGQRLNPEWVNRLMGFPDGWLNLE